MRNVSWYENLKLFPQIKSAHLSHFFDCQKAVFSLKELGKREILFEKKTTFKISQQLFWEFVSVNHSVWSLCFFRESDSISHFVPKWRREKKFHLGMRKKSKAAFEKKHFHLCHYLQSIFLGPKKPSSSLLCLTIHPPFSSVTSSEPWPPVFFLLGLRKLQSPPRLSFSFISGQPARVAKACWLNPLLKQWKNQATN